jgi:hypothetical protein
MILRERVFQSVFQNLLFCSLYRINPISLCKGGEINHHITNFLLYVFTLLLRDLYRLIRSQPLKDLEQFCGLNSEGHSQIFRRVVLCPVSLFNKVFYFLYQIFHYDLFVMEFVSGFCYLLRVTIQPSIIRPNTTQNRA